jgi:hypothetical protein
MSEIEVKEEVKETPSQEQQVQEVEASKPEQVEQKLSTYDQQKDNWAQANEVLRLQKQRITELEERLTNSQSAAKQAVEEVDEFASLDPDEYLSVKDARKLAERIAEKKGKEAAKEIIEQYSRSRSLEDDESRMRSQHDDYDFVVENFAVPLIKNNPALAYKVQTSKNPAQTAYMLGKLDPGYQESSQKQAVSPRAERVLKNTSRPLSGNAASGPLKSQADNFSNMSQEDVWSMSQKYAKGA